MRRAGGYPSDLTDAQWQVIAVHLPAEVPGKAVAICASCPVRTQCLEYALRNSIKHGIWGGLNPEERTRECRRRTRRPLAA